MQKEAGLGVGPREANQQLFPSSVGYGSDHTPWMPHSGYRVLVPSSHSHFLPLLPSLCVCVCVCTCESMCMCARDVTYVRVNI